MIDDAFTAWKSVHRDVQNAWYLERVAQIREDMRAELAEYVTYALASLKMRVDDAGWSHGAIVDHVIHYLIHPDPEVRYSVTQAAQWLAQQAVSKEQDQALEHLYHAFSW